MIDEGSKTPGTIIMGRRAYNVGAAQDGFADNPYQVPTIILTHQVPQAVPKGAEVHSNRQKLSQATELS